MKAQEHIVGELQTLLQATMITTIDTRRITIEGENTQRIATLLRLIRNA